MIDNQANHWIIGEIGTWFIRSGRGGRALPARHIDSLQVLCHLSDLNGIQGSIGVGRSLVLVVGLEQLPEFLGLRVGGIRLLEGTTLGCDCHLNHSFEKARGWSDQTDARKPRKLTIFGRIRTVN